MHGEAFSKITSKDFLVEQAIHRPGFYIFCNPGIPGPEIIDLRQIGLIGQPTKWFVNFCQDLFFFSTSYTRRAAYGPGQVAMIGFHLEPSVKSE